METQSLNNTFTTKDLYISALCYSKGARLLKVNRQGRVCWFVFEDKNLCEEYQRQYFAKTIDVNVMAYVEALRTLKDLVFAEE